MEKNPSLMTDGTPDIYHLRLASFGRLLQHYGTESTQSVEANIVMNKVIEQVS